MGDFTKQLSLFLLGPGAHGALACGDLSKCRSWQSRRHTWGSVSHELLIAASFVAKEPK